MRVLSFAARRPRRGLFAALLAVLAPVFAASPAACFSTRTLADWVLPAGTAGGRNLANLGDFNGDGYPDFASSEVQFSSGTGRVRVYFGGAQPDTTADVTFAAPLIGENFGLLLAAAGDLNADGYADAVVGSNGGHVYVFLGGQTPNGVSDLTVTGSVSEGFGQVGLSGIGDVNVDGFEDFAVTTFTPDKVQIYYGGATLNATVDVSISVANASGIRRLGDFNGDGVDDFAVSAYTDERIYVLLGRKAGPSTVLDQIIITGPTDAAAYFGWDLENAGDVNGDGRPDFVAGAPFDTVGGAGTAGKAFVYVGSTVAFPNPFASFVDTEFSSAGDNVEPLGDVNGDGLADFVVCNNGSREIRALVFGGRTGTTVAGYLPGAPRRDANTTVPVTGNVGDWNGDGMPDLVIGWSIDAVSIQPTTLHAITVFQYKLLAPRVGDVWAAGGSAQVSWWGHDAADIEFSADGGASWVTLARNVGGREENTLTLTVPNVTGDRCVLRLVESGSDASAGHVVTLAGTFRVRSLPSVGAVLARVPLSASGSISGEALGTSVASAGDVNGDGYPDVIVGSPNSSAGGSGSGKATLYFGGPTQDAAADLTLTGAAGEQLGWSVAGAGDVNGDGFADVIVGAPFNDTGFTDAGRAYIYFGGASMNATADVTLSGVEIFEEIGMAVAGIGDVNRDGFADVAVGAPFSNQVASDAGRVYVLFGGSSMNNVVDVTLGGSVANERFGSALCGAGDFDRDGYDDLVVGSPNWGTSSTSSAGRWSLFRGGTTVDAIADLTVNGRTSWALGTAVAAGDVTGDGAPDLIVGAPNADVSGSNTGSVFVYAGGAAADTLADFAVHGSAVSDGLGSAVAALGDVNGDGIGDLGIGVPFADPLGVNSAGRAQVHFGGRLSATPDLTFEGTGTFEDFGKTVCGIGDWQGDGFGDLAIGAPDADAPLTDAGRVRWVLMSRYLVQAPNGGETWNVGALQSVKWLGAEPADVWLSDDGGTSWTLAASHVGGAATNQIQVRVPHQPTRFARIKLTPSASGANGFDTTDSLFTIQASIALLGLSVAQAPSGPGVEVSWNTNPGPADLAGYTLERAAETTGDAPSRGGEIDATRWITVAERTTATHIVDADGTTSSRYRLTAINGLGEALVLGETNAVPLTPLSAGPLPYRGGDLLVRFVAAASVTGTPATTRVGVYDGAGRLVRMLASGPLVAGPHTARWDGRDAHGRLVPRGVYALRAETAGQVSRHKFVVLP